MNYCGQLCKEILNLPNFSSESPLKANSFCWLSFIGPNPGLQSSLAGRPYNPRSPNLDSPASGENVSKDKKGTPAQFGSNIHTLKHDEDDGPFGDRNAFWNGNSTQYGGDNNK